MGGGQGPQAGEPIAAGQTTGAGTGGASSAYTGGASDLTGLSYGQPYVQPTMVGDVAAQQAAGVGVTPGLTGINTAASGVGPEALSYQAAAGPSTPAFTGQEFGGGDVFTPAGREAALTGVDTASAPQMSTYGGDVGTMQYPGGAQPEIAGTINFPDRVKEALMKGVELAKSKPKTTAALLGLTALSAAGPQPVQQFTPDQLASAGITTDFDGQRVVYRNADGEEIDYRTALEMIQQASQDFGPGGQRRASGVRLGYERVNPQEGSQPVGSIEELRDVAIDSLRKDLVNQVVW